MYEMSHHSMLAMYSNLKNFLFLNDVVWAKPSIRSDFDGIPYFTFDILYVIKQQELYYRIFPVEPKLSWNFELAPESEKICIICVKTLAHMLIYLEQDFLYLRPNIETLNFLEGPIDQMEKLRRKNWILEKGIL